MHKRFCSFHNSVINAGGGSHQTLSGTSTGFRLSGYVRSWCPTLTLVEAGRAAGRRPIVGVVEARARGTPDRSVNGSRGGVLLQGLRRIVEGLARRNLPLGGAGSTRVGAACGGGAVIDASVRDTAAPEGSRLKLGVSDQQGTQGPRAHTRK